MHFCTQKCTKLQIVQVKTRFTPPYMHIYLHSIIQCISYKYILYVHVKRKFLKLNLFIYAKAFSDTSQGKYWRMPWIVSINALGVSMLLRRLWDFIPTRRNRVSVREVPRLGPTTAASQRGDRRTETRQSSHWGAAPRAPRRKLAHIKMSPILPWRKNPLTLPWGR